MDINRAYIRMRLARELSEAADLASLEGLTRREIVAELRRMIERMESESEAV